MIEAINIDYRATVYQFAGNRYTQMLAHIVAFHRAAFAKKQKVYIFWAKCFFLHNFLHTCTKKIGSAVQFEGTTMRDTLTR